MSFFLGIDLGTSYFKAGVFDESGKLCGLGRHAVEKNHGEGKSCELSLAVFWTTLRLSVEEALQEAALLPRDITAVSYSSQANSFILLDSSDQPLTPFILWTDERVTAFPAPLQVLINKTDFLAKTGLGIQPGRQSLLAKADWFRENQPLVWDGMKRIMSISDYLMFALTGHKVSDFSTSSMTGLLNIPEGRWWVEAADIFSIDLNYLSIPLAVGTLIGNLTMEGASRIGLSSRSLLYSGGLDHHMVAIGAGIPYYNAVSESTGTVLACVKYQKGYEPCIGINVAQGLDPNHSFRMAFDQNGAVALEWYCRKYANESTLPDLLEQAGKVKIGCDGLIAKARSNEYEGLSGFNNIKTAHTHAHFVRAILESTGMSLRHLVNELEGNNESEALIPSGGGARSQLWLQIKADMLNKTFLLSESGELACKGAAMVCSVGTGCFDSIYEAIEEQVSFIDRIYPNPADTSAYKKWYESIKYV